MFSLHRDDRTPGRAPTTRVQVILRRRLLRCGFILLAALLVGGAAAILSGCSRPAWRAQYQRLNSQVVTSGSSENRDVALAFELDEFAAEAPVMAAVRPE